MNVHRLQCQELTELFAARGTTLTGLFMVNGFLQVMVSEELGLMHLSVSHPRRYPTWDEIRDLRYQFLPNDRTFAILFPPKEQYVNVHENCFHLHEVPQMHETTSLLVLP
jgi:hypothetical protein